MSTLAQVVANGMSRAPRSSQRAHHLEDLPTFPAGFKIAATGEFWHALLQRGAGCRANRSTYEVATGGRANGGQTTGRRVLTFLPENHFELDKRNPAPKDSLDSTRWTQFTPISIAG
jgi:hypothetical protein